MIIVRTSITVNQVLLNVINAMIIEFDDRHDGADFRQLGTDVKLSVRVKYDDGNFQKWRRWSVWQRVPLPDQVEYLDIFHILHGQSFVQMSWKFATPGTCEEH